MRFRPDWHLAWNDLLYDKQFCEKNEFIDFMHGCEWIIEIYKV